MTFGERLAELRKKQDLSQNELAKKLNISKSTLAMYETDKRQPNFETQTKIADFFEVSVDYLLGRQNYIINAETISTVADAAGTSYAAPKIAIEIAKLAKEYGIEHFGFFNAEKWKDLSLEDVDEIRRHFEWVAQKAKERNDNDENEE